MADVIRGNFNKTPRRFAVTRTLDGDYTYREITIKRLTSHMVGVIYPDGVKRKYKDVRGAQEGINQYYRKVNADVRNG